MTEKQKQIAEAFRGRPVEFGRYFVSTMFTVPSAQFHYTIAQDYLDPTVTNMNYIAPRGHAKSSFVACVIVLYHLIYDPGRKFVVIVSKTEGHAIRLIETIKEVMQSVAFRAVFGTHNKDTARIWQERLVILSTGDALMAKGMGQQVVGMKIGSQRPTLIILDDPEDMNNTKTPEALEYNLRWFLQMLYPTRDPRRSKCIVIGTPQHERCIVETLMNAQNWRSRRWSAIQEDGTALWPEWFPMSRIESERRTYASINKISSFYREYLCKIIAAEEQSFPPDQARYWKGELFHDEGLAYLKVYRRNFQDLEQPEVIPVNVFMGVDPASSIDTRANFSTIVPLAIDQRGNRYHLPYFRGRVKPLDLAQKIITWYLINKPLKTRVESVGYQDMLRQFLMTQSTYIPGLDIKEKPRQAKKGEGSRLESLQPFWAQGQIWIMEGMKDLEDEYFGYPKGKNDDLLDGTYYAAKGNYLPVHTIEKPVLPENELRHYIGVETDGFEFEHRHVRKEDADREARERIQDATFFDVMT